MPVQDVLSCSFHQNKSHYESVVHEGSDHKMCSDVSQNEYQLNEVTRTVSTWADNNRMSLNITKTRSLLVITL